MEKKKEGGHWVRRLEITWKELQVKDKLGAGRKREIGITDIMHFLIIDHGRPMGMMTVCTCSETYEFDLDTLNRIVTVNEW